MATDAETPLCELANVTLEYPQPHGAPVRVLAGMNVAVHTGEVVALLGPSGCGKSTILRILAGLIAPKEGTVLRHGVPLVGLNPGVAFVFQNFALFPWLTVAGNVAAALQPLGLTREEIRERVQHTITLVGLAGAQDAYPRQLSGGMKQRAGMARALALRPEVLFMDEPFSQVDALTAESLRAEVIDLWAQKETLRAIVLVSHDIHEVVAMADRIVVLAEKPGRVRTVVEDTLRRPRNPQTPDFVDLVDRLHDVIMGGEVAAAPLPGVFSEALPEARSGEIIGLLELLDARGGREDVFRIATETNREFGQVIAAVQAAALLGLVETPRRTAVLAPRGVELLRSDQAGRKAIWRTQLLGLGLFKKVRDALDRRKDHRVDGDFVLETIAVLMPSEDHDRMFDVFLSWARFGDLFAWDDETRTLTRLGDER